MTLRASVTRGAESWQFFAFVFVAAVTLEIAWISEIGNTWIRLVADTIAFAGTFYIVMLNRWVRNCLVGMLIAIKELEH